MEVDNGHCSSSEDDCKDEIIETSSRHSATVKLDLDTDDIAQKVLRILSVDKEPNRSNAVRALSVEGRFLQIKITAADRKSLQRSLANSLDMCDLAKSTIDLAVQKKWISFPQMFKGLKTKLEDEAKKIQASMQQYSEQLTQQVEHIRGAASDAGSEGGSSITRRFLSTVGGSSTTSPSVGNALMEEVTEGDLLGLDSSSRQRRLSGGSTHSTESSLSTLFQSVPGLAGTTLDTVDSDSETVDEYGSGVIRSATKDQISSVLSRLQGRASTYKDKYRDLVKKYNEVVTENNKCRTVLAQTQDKALDRIEKLKREKKALGEKLRELEENRSSSSPAEHRQHRLEEMLEKCKAEITKNRAKIKELTQENERLSLNVKAAESESDISTLVADRVTNEWKQRIDKVEEEWTERMNKNDADHSIQLATTKAEMHAALEAKDKEIESWRSKCRVLEIQDGQANERWQKKVDELQQVIQALEVEKGDMIEKLSAAKLQGVKAVRDEEEKKREELIAEFAEKEQRLQQDLETRMKEFESVKEGISQLKAVMDSLRGVEDSDKEAEDHEASVFDELERLRRELSEMNEAKQQEVADFKDLLATAAEEHRAEIAELMQEHDEIVSSTRKQQLIELEAVTAKFEAAREEADSLRLKNETLEKQLEQLDETYTLERCQAEKALQQQIDELSQKLKIHQEAQDGHSESEMAGMRDSYTRLCESNDDLKRRLEEVTGQSVEQATVAKQLEATLRGEVDELRAMLESRNSEFKLIEIRKQELEEELATARELSVMHDRLKAELEETRKQRDEIDSLVASLTERAERAEKTLEEDRALLKAERSNLEKSVEEWKKKEGAISSFSESELERRVDAYENMASVSDLSAQTAGEMCTSDELQQLRSEIAHLTEMNAKLTTKISQLEAENDAVRQTKDETQQLLNELKMASEAIHGNVAVPDRVMGSGDEPHDVTMNVEEVQLENIRLSEELKRNMEEIVVARNHRLALEKELSELKSQFAGQKTQVVEAEVLIDLQDEHSKGHGDGELPPEGSSNRISELEEQVNIQLQEIERLTELAMSERQRADKALEDVKEKLTVQESLSSEIKKKDDMIASLEEEVRRANSEEAAVRSQCADSENHCRQLESRIDELVIELDKVHATFNEERARAGGELTELQKMQQEAESRLTDLSEKLKVAEETLLSRERELELAKSNLDTKKSAFEAEISELKEKLKESTAAAMESERSTASLHEVQKSLIEEEKRVLELRHKLQEEQAQLVTLQSEAKQREGQLKNEISLRQDKASPAASKIRALEEHNDKMRLEFIAKASERHCSICLSY
ncbi:GRIP domain-containing protein [Trichostrongylus colubriformis]|uniref:GRIP domain-containing protein n=1 Tax=Trichostrongylus colubriformis TaxID=6319 RepID=A0AAN8FG42_TRICO